MMRKTIGLVTGFSLAASVALIGMPQQSASAATTCGSGYQLVDRKNSAHLSASLYVNLRAGTWCARTARTGSWNGAYGWTRITLQDRYGPDERRAAGDTKSVTQVVKLNRNCVYFWGIGFQQRWVDRGTRNPEMTPGSRTWCYKDVM